MKYNTLLINLILFIIISTNFLYSQQANIDDNPFINRVDYTKILNIPLNIVQNKKQEIDWLSTAKKWKKTFIQSSDKKELDGYYGVLFYSGKPILFTKFSKDKKSYISYFVTRDVILNARFSKENTNYCQAEIDILYESKKKYTFIGPIFFYDGIASPSSLDKNMRFIIFKINTDEIIRNN